MYFKQEVLGRINGLLSFDLIQTVHETKNWRGGSTDTNGMVMS
jgi:hypothetical protein